MKRKVKKNTEWFEEWFDSPYYHILYKNRDDKEAKEFISNLIDYLKPLKDVFFLDVACGKGRHSVYINKLGFNIDGFDLSENSINIAKKQETDSLHFYTNDIRNPLKPNYYSVAFNLFTSFGYFEKEQDNQLAINSIAESLKEGGVLVLDFMNCKKVLNNLTKKEAKIIDEITFNITRDFKNGYIIKDINFTNSNVDFNFQEKVKAISLDDFKSYFTAANLKIEAIFGDYQLNAFDEDTSDRLILVAKKQ
ncbi:MAG: class I SAM-dependent methyltransferase [Flavobacteriales bacterium]|nr:class I SAM-dependent methyltransferase [Flavobacteriales bacterium]